MIPKPYKEVIPDNNDCKEFITIILEDGSTYTGEFSDLRIDRDTIPKGMYAYDLRDVDSTGDICQVKNFIWVNYFGTIIMDEPIPNIENGQIVKEWWFVNE